jgi:hypothetical protein
MQNDGKAAHEHILSISRIEIAAKTSYVIEVRLAS